MSKAHQSARKRTGALLEHLAGQTAPNAVAPETIDSPETPQPTLMTLDEAAAAYEGEWALMRVIGEDEATGEAYGEILLHHPSRGAIDKAARRAVKRDPGVHLAFILGGTQRRTLEEFNALLDKGARGPYVNARW